MTIRLAAIALFVLSLVFAHAAPMTSTRSVDVDGKKVDLTITVAPENLPKESRVVVSRLSDAYFDQWPRIARMIDAPVDRTPKHLTLTFKKGMGHPAHVAGKMMVISADHVRAHPDDVPGVFTHELTHFVQFYPAGCGVPGWFTEGLADLVRYRIHPDSRWAEANVRATDKQKALAAYWQSSAFLLWIEQTFDKPVAAMVSKSCSDGKYDGAVWKRETGATFDELVAEYQESDWVPGAITDAAKPNIVFILADDLGYGELGCYGQEKIKTPNIDRLAAEGVRFTQHYTGAPVCAPARCVLMTGRHLAHAEIRGNRDSGNGRKFPGQWPLSGDAVTIASVLGNAGYVTGGFGKWGLGPSDSSGSPIKQGFDRFYGYNCQRNAHSFYPPFLDSDETEVTVNDHPVPGHARKPEGKVDAADYRAENYSADLILDEALRFIDEHKDEAFFLYLPFLEPHVSMQPPQEWIDRYPREWDDPAQGGKGVYRGQNGYLPHDRPRAAYAAMISDLDEHVGAVMARLEKYGLDKNTIVIFTSDNGATHGAADKRFHVGGVDAEFFNSSGGLRGYKGSCYEGGIRVPCVVRWPGQVPQGREVTAPTYFPDWFPTLAELGGVDTGGYSHDGVDLLPLIKGGAFPGRDQPMIWDFHNYGGIVAIRDGKWKVVRRGMNGKRSKPWELYDIDRDSKESQNVASDHIDVVARLEKQWLDTRIVEPDFPVPNVDGKSSL